MLDPMDANALEGSAAHAVGAMNPRARLVSRGGRRRPNTPGCGGSSASVGRSGACRSSFAAPQQPLSLAEFRDAIGQMDLVPASQSRQPSTSQPQAADAMPDPADDAEAAVAPPPTIDPPTADQPDTVSVAPVDGKEPVSPSNRAGPQVEAAIEKLVGRLVPAVQGRVQALWKARESLAAFAVAVAELREDFRLGFEMSLDEFRDGVASIVDRVTRKQLAESEAYHQFRSLANELGPEMAVVARRMLDEVSDVSEFATSIAKLSRPMVNVASPKYHRSCVQTLLDAEQRLGHKEYLETFQKDVTARVRHILIDWLVDVAGRYRFGDETLHLSINVFDRFMGEHRVERGSVQLIGVASLFLCSKYEEIYPPDVNDLVGMAAHTYSKDEILTTERQIFTKLAFRVTMPSSFGFAQAILAEQDPMPTPMQRHMVSYLLEAVLHTEVYGAHRPSRLACAAVYISRIWCAVPTPRPCDEVVECVKVIIMAVHMTYRIGERCRAHHNKYSSSRYERVSTLPLPVTHIESHIGEQVIDPAQVSAPPTQPPATYGASYGGQVQMQPTRQLTSYGGGAAAGGQFDYGHHHAPTGHDAMHQQQGGQQLQQYGRPQRGASAGSTTSSRQPSTHQHRR